MKYVTGFIEVLGKFCSECDRLEMREDSDSKVTLVCRAREFGSCYRSYTGDNTLGFWR
jgi:hypothetical protein